jgi:vacuolar-type H+-ATPase subunit I/STV1
MLSIHDDLKSKLDAVISADEHAQESLEAATEAGSAVAAIQSKVSAAFDVISKYEQQIADSKESSLQGSSEISAIAARGKKATSAIDEAQSALSDMTEETRILQGACQELNAEIAKTLEAANRVGMAGSFNSRKEELKASLITWAVLFVISIGSILVIGLWMIHPVFGQNALEVKLEDVGLKLIVVAPLVWLAWMSARQYGYISRIREDYSFKYATAMAFEGYKKQAQEINEGLLGQLLKQAIETAGQNPIRLYSSTDNHASPVQEALDKVKGVTANAIAKGAGSN